MKLLSLFILVCVISLGAFSPLPAIAQGTKCDPAKVIAQAAALKSTGNQTADIDALRTLAHAALETLTACQPSDLGTFNNPVPMGTAFDNCDGDGCYTITILEVHRGAEAIKILSKATRDYTKPKEGQEWALVKFSFKLHSAPKELWPYFQAITKNQEIQQHVHIPGLPEPQKPENIYPPAETEFWWGYFIFADDPAPKLKFHEFFFSLKASG